MGLGLAGRSAGPYRPDRVPFAFSRLPTQAGSLPVSIYMYRLTTQLYTSLRQKVQIMEYCIYEALTMEHREVMRNGLSLALHSDARAHRFSIRFAVTSLHVETARGLLGHSDYIKLKKSGKASDDTMRDAFDLVLRDFCTFGLYAQSTRNQARARHIEFDEPLYTHMKHITEVFDSDAEQTMVNCGMSMCGVLGEDFFSNCKLLVKDPTHAARRVLSRPWACHPTLKVIISTIVMDRGSIMERIKNSGIFKGVFEGALIRLPNCSVNSSRLKNLSMAEHRFDSVVHPLVRGVLLFDAVVYTAIHIAVHRSGEDEGHDAVQFLQYASGEDGELRLLLFAMMADGGSAVLEFIRWWDSELHDPAEIYDRIGLLVNTLDWLFNQRHCLSFEHSYTRLMLVHLQQTRSIVAKGRPSAIGGFSKDRTIKEAFATMSDWIVVMLEVLKAEFPSWNLLQAFAVLNLRDVTRLRASDESTLLRFAQVFRLSVDDLRRDILRVLPLALKLRHLSPELSNFEHWKLALRSLEANGESLPALKKLLVRYGSYTGCTTSGVERVHSDQYWLFREAAERHDERERKCGDQDRR